VILFFVLGLAVSSLWLLAVPVLGVVIGVVVLVLGIVLGGKIFDARQPELMAFATNNG
jgi:ABC-2 type transport system permease protein